MGPRVTLEISPLDALMLAQEMQVPAACPACGGSGCDKCSHTGQAEFCAADAGAYASQEPISDIASIRGVGTESGDTKKHERGPEAA